MLARRLLSSHRAKSVITTGQITKPKETQRAVNSQIGRDHYGRESRVQNLDP